MITKQNTQGFTLFEVLIALTIVAIAAAGLLKISNQNLKQTSVLEHKTLATIMAENIITDMQIMARFPNIGHSNQTIVMAGRKWQAQINTKNTQDPEIRSIEVSISIFDKNNPVAALNSFVSKP